MRRVLQEAGGDSYIVTAPGQGYRFATEVRRGSASTSRLQAAIAGATAATPPTPILVDPLEARHEAAVGVSVAVAARRSPRIIDLVGLALLICLGVGVVALWEVRRAGHEAETAAQVPFTPPPHSVAVLAFANMSGDPGLDYFSDGLSEELINSISRINALRVVARTSAFAFKGRSATVSEIGRALNVSAVLEGSVRRDGRRLRIAAQLVDPISGYELWSRLYDRNVGDEFDLQTDIAGAVAEALQVTLLTDDVAKLVIGGTKNAQAFDAYLRGLRFMQQGGESSYRAAVSEFDQSLQLDAHYAAAQAERAQALASIATNASSNDLPQVHAALSQALAAANTAIEWAPTYGPAHTARGTVLEDMLDLRSAEAEMARGHLLAPNSPEASMPYALLEAQLGHSAQAEALVRQAVAQDPLSSSGYATIAKVLYANRQYSEIPAALQHVLASNGVCAPCTQAIMRKVELVEGNAEKARKACSVTLSMGDAWCLAIAENALGHFAQAQAQLIKLKAAWGSNGAYNYAEIYAKWGDRASAIHWLATACDLHDAGLVPIRTDPMLDSIHDMPEFKAILSRLDFPS